MSPKLLTDVLGFIGVNGNPNVNNLLMVATLAFARIVPTLFLNPFLGGASVPSQVKMGLSACIVFLLLPLLQGAPLVDAGAPFLLLFIKEVAIGTTLGFLSALVFHAFATAGRITDTYRGANMAEVFVPQLREQASPLGQLFLQAAVVIFLLGNGHLIFIRGLVNSFTVLPVWTFPDFVGGEGARPVDEVIRASADLFKIALQLAGPAVLALFLTDVAFGLLNRAAPQMNAFTLSFPIKMLVGLLVTSWMISLMLSRMVDHLNEMPEFLHRFVLLLVRR